MQETQENLGVPYLSGIRVLDFSMLTPGPFASQILADLGATVLKVERPRTGDLERVTVPSYFHAYNRGKGSIALNLQAPEDRALAHKLVAEADIVLDGFRPGVMDRLGMGYSQLSEIQDKLIYVSLNGLGSWGPFAQDRGHDSDYMARCGALSVTPRPGGVPMYDLPLPISDYAAGMYAVIAIMGELGRVRTRAVRIEVPVMAAGLAWMFPKIVRELEEPEHGNGERELPGVGCFRTRDDRYVTITAVEDHVFSDLVRAIGHPELAGHADFASFKLRRAQAPRINALVAEAVAKFDFKACQVHMEKHGVPCAPVNTPAEVMEDLQVVALDILHQEPCMHADLPIFGIPRVRHVRPPGLDEDGNLVRETGWQGLDELLVSR